MSRYGIAGVVLLLSGVGCEETGPSADLDPPGSVVAPASPSPWLTSDGSAQISVDDPELMRALAAATGRARTGLEDARRRWEEADSEERAGWALKWATQTEDGGTEHLWVLPLAWSAYRVEGLLLDSPGRPLRQGHSKGDLIAFPIEEVSDWLRIDDQGRREGGYTVEVLEERLGAPPASPDG